MRHNPIAIVFLLSFVSVGCLQETGVPIDATQDPNLQDPMNRRSPWIQNMPLPTQGPRAIPANVARELTRPDGRPLLPTDAPDTNGKTSTSLFDPYNNAGGFSVDIAQSPGTEYRLAQIQFPSPRPLTAFAGVLLANNPGSFGPTSVPFSFRRSIRELNAIGGQVDDLWVLGRIRIGLQGVTFSVYFDMPLGDLIQLPVIAETVEISARLIRGIEIDLHTASSSDVAALVEPPVLSLAPGDTVSPAIVNANAYIGQGITAESNALRFASVKAFVPAGIQIPIIIPDGVNQVRVTAGTASDGPGPFTNVNWGFQTSQSINGTGSFLPNDCCWRDIPPNAIGIVLNTGAGATVGTFQLEFKLGLQGTF